MIKFKNCMDFKIINFHAIFLFINLKKSIKLNKYWVYKIQVQII